MRARHRFVLCGKAMRMRVAWWLAGVVFMFSSVDIFMIRVMVRDVIEPNENDDASPEDVQNSLGVRETLVCVRHRHTVLITFDFLSPVLDEYSIDPLNVFSN